MIKPDPEYDPKHYAETFGAAAIEMIAKDAADSAVLASHFVYRYARKAARYASKVYCNKCEGDGYIVIRANGIATSADCHFCLGTGLSNEADIPRR